MDDDKFSLLHRLLSLMGKTIVACGGPSFGLMAKLGNTYCSALIFLPGAEAMHMLAVEAGERAGAKLLLADAGLNGCAEASEDPRCRDLHSRGTAVKVVRVGHAAWTAPIGY